MAVRTTLAALDAARDAGLLGENILGTGWDFDLELREGAGAFVCGEESALIASLEGERGMPRPRPPFPAERGYLGQPTNINNVETFANVPPIILRGHKWYSSIGTEGSKGTKIFALAGKVNNTGLIEVPMGITLRQVVFDIGGGVARGRHFKAAQTGGPSGGCVPAEFLDLPIDYDSLKDVGAIMGSGGLIVMDDNTCMVDVARFFLEFVQDESCGKCTPCRVGTKHMLEILERITEGHGRPGDIEELERLGKMVQKTSLCGLGQTGPNPVLSTVRHFREEYEAHIHDHHCPAGVCRVLSTFVIDEEACKACGLCRKECPAEAIEGERKAAHRIIQEKCIQCGRCREVCPFEAVNVLPAGALTLPQPA
jgi:NADP-reducing hydrogenase subunit HndC